MWLQRHGSFTLAMAAVIGCHLCGTPGPARAESPEPDAEKTLRKNSQEERRHMVDITDADAIIVDEDSVASGDRDNDIVEANIDFLNAMLHYYYKFDELSQDALRSYEVDFYLCQVGNGGFPQFVKNSQWGSGTVQLVQEGLRAIGAEQHLHLFEEGAALVASLGDARLKVFLENDLYSDISSRELAVLKPISNKFFDLDKRESLRTLNGAWLRTHPKLVPASVQEIQAELQRRAGLVPDREQRIAEAEANVPRYFKLIRALVAKAGQKLERVTAGDPSREFEGKKTLAWYFLTDQGLFHMIDAGGKAIMFRGESTTDRVCEIDAP
jgi:hypothetical protein